MKEGWKFKLIPQLAYFINIITNGTLRLKVQGDEKISRIKESGRTIIFAVWHGDLWLPTYHLKDEGYVALVSPSTDGEYIGRTLSKLGWKVIRGSTSRGGARSLLKLIKELRSGNDIAITPDGPRGPFHEVKPGIIYLAQKTDSVIIPVGVAIDKKKVFNSWDEFSLPYPFSKATLVYGEEIEIGADIESNQFEEYSRLIKEKINQTIEEAEELLEANI